MIDHIFGGVVDYAWGEKSGVSLCLISVERLFLRYYVTSRTITALREFAYIALCKLAVRQKIDGAIDEEYKEKIRRLFSKRR